MNSVYTRIRTSYTISDSVHLISMNVLHTYPVLRNKRSSSEDAADDKESIEL